MLEQDFELHPGGGTGKMSPDDPSTRIFLSRCSARGGTLLDRVTGFVPAAVRAVELVVEDTEMGDI